MSGILTLLAGTGGGSIVATGWSVGETNINPGIRNCSRTWITDGTSTRVGTFGSNPNWWTPTTAGIGSAWSVRFTQTSSSGTTIGGMTSGTWYALTSDRTINFQNTGSAVLGSGTGTIDFSPDGGTTVVPSGSLSWSVGYTP